MRTKMKIILIILFIAISSHSSGLHFTFDKGGKIAEDHLALTPDENQVLSLSQFRFMVLNKDQKELLNKHNLETYDTLFVINNNYRDCTCNDNVFSDVILQRQKSFITSQQDQLKANNKIRLGIEIGATLMVCLIAIILNVSL